MGTHWQFDTCWRVQEGLPDLDNDLLTCMFIYDISFRNRKKEEKDISLHGTQTVWKNITELQLVFIKEVQLQLDQFVLVIKKILMIINLAIYYLTSPLRIIQQVLACNSLQFCTLPATEPLQQSPLTLFCLLLSISASSGQ